MMDPDDRPPVAIAGAGPVGLALALALARAGVRSRVLEAKRALDPHSRATLIVPRSLEMFHRLGVLDAFLAEGQRNDAIRMLRATDRKLLLRFDFATLASETPTPFALALSQDRTERILLSAVQATGLVEVAFDTALDRYEQTAHGVRVHDARGGVAQASFLIGADGAHSRVRQQLDWPLEGKTYPTRAMLADVRIGPEHDTTEGWIADPQAASFTIAIRFADGVWRIIEAAVPEGLTDADLPARSRALAERIFGSGAWRETLWSAVYHKHERRARRYVDRRVALAGDAAHLNSPAGGQGMNAGLADADLLARQLCAALAHPDQADALLAAYERERTLVFDRDIRSLTNGLETMETLPAWLRKLLFSAIGLARRAGVERLMTRKLSMLTVSAPVSR